MTTQKGVFTNNWGAPKYLLGEVVWGDGTRVERQVVSATDLAPFGSKRFLLPVDLAGKKWVRFAAWDSAGNGAFSQPVHLR